MPKKNLSNPIIDLSLYKVKYRTPKRIYLKIEKEMGRWFSPFSFLNFHNFLRLRTEVKSTYRLQRYAQGFYRVRRNLSTSSRPTKKPRSQELTDQQKHLNQEKSSDRVKSEQTISGVNRYNAARG
ncbi:hypothetical protein D4Z78_13375 [Okeania hirsuta]|nr:hypothetical protein D4Z78_13375 [Okeania hirsuta]